MFFLFFKAVRSFIGNNIPLVIGGILIVIIGSLFLMNSHKNAKIKQLTNVAIVAQQQTKIVVSDNVNLVKQIKNDATTQQQVIQDINTNDTNKLITHTAFNSIRVKKRAALKMVEVQFSKDILNTTPEQEQRLRQKAVSKVQIESIYSAYALAIK